MRAQNANYRSDTKPMESFDWIGGWEAHGSRNVTR